MTQRRCLGFLEWQVLDTGECWREENPRTNHLVLREDRRRWGCGARTRRCCSSLRSDVLQENSALWTALARPQCLQNFLIGWACVRHCQPLLLATWRHSPVPTRRTNDSYPVMVRLAQGLTSTPAMVSRAVYRHCDIYLHEHSPLFRGGLLGPFRQPCDFASLPVSSTERKLLCTNPLLLRLASRSSCPARRIHHDRPSTVC